MMCLCPVCPSPDRLDQQASETANPDTSQPGDIANSVRSTLLQPLLLELESRPGRLVGLDRFLWNNKLSLRVVWVSNRR